MRAAIVAVFALAGCSAAGVPIYEPEHETALSWPVPQSELEAVAGVVRDVISMAVPALLHAPSGAIAMQSTTSGTLTIAGTADPMSDTAETLTMTVACDAYMPKLDVAVRYTEWRFSTTSAALPTLTLAFTEEPIAMNDLGFITGSFHGRLTETDADGANPSDVDARLTVNGELLADKTGKVNWQLLHISGVIYSPAFDFYYNDAVFQEPSK